MHWVVGPLALVEAAMAIGLAALLAIRHRRAVREPLHRVELAGNGTHYVFLHGLGATHRYWRDGIEAAPLAGRVTLIDLLGFGESPKPWFRHTLDRHLERLHAIIGGHRDVVLIGHSLGASLALAYAARHPEPVARLVLLSLPCFNGGEQAAFRWLRQTAEGWLFTNVLLMTLACVITRRVLGGLLPYLRPDLPRAIAQDVVKHSWMASTTSLWEVVYHHDFEADAAALSARLNVTCVHGERDMTVPADGVRRLAAGRRNWQVVTLPDVDHHPWLRRPGLCRELLAPGAPARFPQRPSEVPSGDGCAVNEAAPPGTATGFPTSSSSGGVRRPR